MRILDDGAVLLVRAGSRCFAPKLASKELCQVAIVAERGGINTCQSQIRTNDTSLIQDLQLDRLVLNLTPDRDCDRDSGQ